MFLYVDSAVSLEISFFPDTMSSVLPSREEITILFSLSGNCMIAKELGYSIENPIAHFA